MTTGLPTGEFSGGNETNQVFGALGFTVRNKTNHIGHWKIAPGPKASIWERCRNDKSIAVGWTEFGDLTEFIDDRPSFEEEYMKINKAKQKAKAQEQMNELWGFLHLEPGDLVLSNRGLGSIVGVGRVTGYYAYRSDYAEYRHAVPMDWFDTNERPIPPQASKYAAHWFQGTVEELDKQVFEQLIGHAGQDGRGLGKEWEARLNKLYDEFCAKGQVEFVTFHPSYSYEEFMEGITVDIEGEGVSCKELKYRLRPGIFKNLCKRALGGAIGLLDDELPTLTWRQVYENYMDLKDDVQFEKAARYVLIIDEINRGDIAKIFGELITLLEADKRIGQPNEIIVRLPASGDLFGVPPNLFIIGTMNTADRSIALLDVALRRRFGFIEMNPDFEALKGGHIEKNKPILTENGVYDLLHKSVQAIQLINKKLCEDKTIGRDRQIGQSFLFKVWNPNDLHLVWKHEVLPLLEEYCYGDYCKINKMLFGHDDEIDTEWIGLSEGIKPIENVGTMLDAIIKNKQD